jgi:hypothetical protein
MKLSLILVFFIAFAALFSACSSNNTVTGPVQSVSNPITSDTVTGKIHGTMLAGKTYYIKDSIIVQAKDTLLLQEGVTCYALSNSCVIFIQGTFLSNGTKDKPNLFTVKANQARGAWGGFLCDSPKVVSFKWTKVEYTGGPDAQGSPRQVVRLNADAANTSQFISEDSWFGNSVDDAFKIYGGTGHILRNTLYNIGKDDADAINIKQGWTGEVAYNVVWEPAGSCIKIESAANALTYITKVNVHNNTCINSGFRRLGEIGYGVLVDLGGQAQVWNNIIVNCRYGIFLGSDGDTVNTHFGNNLFYATVDSLKGTLRFYPKDGVLSRMKSSTDIVSVDPMFTSFHGTDADLTATVDNNNYRLLPGSPAFGKGLMNFGTSTAVGDADLGAYTNNTAASNQH